MKKCLNCQSQIPIGRFKYCSKFCVKQKWYKKHKEYKDVLDKPCVVCGMHYKRDKWHPTSITCGRKCSKKAVSQESRRKRILYVQEWRKRNPDKVRAYHRKNYSNYIEKKRMQSRVRRAASITLEQWLSICNTQKNRCAWCKNVFKANELSLDHIHPVSKGGGNDADNLQALCLPCNQKKHNKIIPRSEFILEE